MNIFVAETGTDRPEGSVVEAPWTDLGAAHDSTLPSDAGVIRLQMQEAEVFARQSASAYIPDLGVYASDAAVEIDDTGVLSISTLPH
jgi:hypothetical protein